MFTEANTEGFTSRELEIMNAALALRIENEEDEKSACDAINNAWKSGATVLDLI